MKLLVDENLPPRLIRELAGVFPESVHATSVLPEAADAVLWEYAKANGFCLLTKDKDFANFSLALGAPPKVILLQTGNCSTTDLIRILRSSATQLSEFEREAERSPLVLS